MAVPAAEIFQLRQEKPIELFSLDLNPIGVNQALKFCNFKQANGSDIVFQGVTYTALPIRAEGFELNSQGRLPTPKIEISNIFGVITAFTIDFGDLVGAKLTRKKTLPKYLDGQPGANPLLEFRPSIWVVRRKISETKLSVTFELKSVFDLSTDTMLPNRLMTKYHCVWRYRGDGCFYSGPPVADEFDNPVGTLEQDQCGKRLTSCELRFGPFGATSAADGLPFGGFPGLDEI